MALFDQVGRDQNLVAFSLVSFGRHSVESTLAEVWPSRPDPNLAESTPNET